MRHLIRIAMLVALTQTLPAAFAQSDQGSKAGTYNAGPGGVAAGYKVDQPNPGNCGTPDDPKPCGPLPEHALKTYPKHHRASGDNG